MRVAIVHDDLVQWGGAERVLLGLCEIYPQAQIFTSVFDRSSEQLSKRFAHKKVITSVLQNIPEWKSLYKALLPFYPLAFEQFNFDNYDLVISSTSRFAKSVITKPETKHICFCHTPPRFLWHFSGYGHSRLLESLMTKLRILDQISARRVDFFIAGSENARKRIKKVYKVEAKVVYPFVDLERFKDVQSFDGGYFIMIGRPNKYKRMDLAKKACEELGVELKIISGRLDDDLVVEVLAGCKALIIAGEEDFGLTSIEAQALGKPVIAFKSGGVLETVVEEKTGIFFDHQTVESLKNALYKFQSKKINPLDCKENAAKFSKENFIKSFKQTVASLM